MLETTDPDGFFSSTLPFDSVLWFYPANLPRCGLPSCETTDPGMLMFCCDPFILHLCGSDLWYIHVYTIQNPPSEREYRRKNIFKRGAKSESWNYRYCVYFGLNIGFLEFVHVFVWFLCPKLCPLAGQFQASEELLRFHIGLWWPPPCNSTLL